jgi:lysophospholipase L1-like esterase
VGVLFSELRRARANYAEAINYHTHRDVREFMIHAATEGLVDPIVVLGDSITEMARLPEAIDGHPVVNAGIGGATIGDFISLAPRLLDGVKPSLCVVALGANDALGANSAAGETYTRLLNALKPVCPHLLAYAVTPLDGSAAINLRIRAAANAAAVRFVETPVVAGSTLPDRIHLNAAGRRTWIAGLVAAISAPHS